MIIPELNFLCSPIIETVIKNEKEGTGMEKESKWVFFLLKSIKI